MYAIPFVLMFLCSFFYPPFVLGLVFLYGLTIQEEYIHSNILLLGLCLCGALLSIKATKFLPTLIPSNFGYVYWLDLLLFIFVAFSLGRLISFLMDLKSKRRLQGT